MSRRKQAKPQFVYLEPPLTCSDSDIQNINSHPRDVHVCESCCAEYSSLSDLLEHQIGCTKNPLVLIVSESPTPPSQTFSSPLHDVEELMDDTENVDGLQDFIIQKGQDEEREIKISADCNIFDNACPSQSDSENHTDNATADNSVITSVDPSVLVQAESSSAMVTDSSFSSNVIIENIEGTQVAVAQFPQDICQKSNSKFTHSMTIPDLVQQLMALQQQQVRQLKLIEQIRHQILLLGAQNAAAPSNCQGASGIYKCSPLITLSSELSQQLAEAAGLAQSLASQSASISKIKQVELAVLSSNQNNETVLTGRDTSQTRDAESCKHLISRLSSCIPASKTLLSQNNTDGTSFSSCHIFATNNASNLAKNFSLPHPSNGNYVLANTLPGIVEELNALTALAKLKKGKLSDVTSLEDKRPFDEGLFKHKCRFCAKVFGSDSALKIHLRSHTGERPYKCNVCGNRFSTRGNLKVHFQRHKEKYPNLQMNPYPVPEHLDNVPTSTGIPYGMSMLPDKPASMWFDGKPSATILPGLLASPSQSISHLIKKEAQVLPINRPSSPGVHCFNWCETVEGEKINQRDFSKHVPILKKKCNDVTKSLCTSTTLDSNGSENHSADDVSSPTNSPTPSLYEKYEPKFLFGSFSDWASTSETTKLQQLVENIDKNCTEPNKCMICHRVLSCQSALKMHYRTHTGERPFKCKICGRAFTTKGNLKTHYTIHRAMPQFLDQHSCPFCQEKFTNAMVLQRHIRMHMDGQIHTVASGYPEQDTCSLGKDCNEKCVDEKMEMIQSAWESKAASPVDTPCPSPTSTQLIKTTGLTAQVLLSQENDLLIDMSENGSVEGEYFTITASTYNDQLSQSPISTALSETSCDSLPKVSSTLDNYISLSSETLPKTPIILDLPNLSSSLDLYTAEAQNCGIPMMFSSFEHGRSNMCNICNKTFTCQSALDIHYRSHTKERPFLCITCNRGFSTKGNLKQHMLTHQLRDLPSCLFEPAKENLLSPLDSSMGFVSPSKIKLEFNGVISTNGKDPVFELTASSGGSPQVPSAPSAQLRRVPKQHFCHTCGKTFSSSSALQIHERTHTGERPFACTICGRAFTTKGNLKVHMGTHMWSGSRRGRRLSVESPLSFLKSSPVKDQESFPKRAVSNGEAASTWTQRVRTPLTTGLALKSNEISVIQNRSLPHTSLSTGLDGISAIGGLTANIEKADHAELKRGLPWLESVIQNGSSFYFTQLTEENKTH